VAPTPRLLLDLHKDFLLLLWLHHLLFRSPMRLPKKFSRRDVFLLLWLSVSVIVGTLIVARPGRMHLLQTNSPDLFRLINEKSWWRTQSEHRVIGGLDFIGTMAISSPYFSIRLSIVLSSINSNLLITLVFIDCFLN